MPVTGPASLHSETLQGEDEQEEGRMWEEQEEERAFGIQAKQHLKKKDSSFQLTLSNTHEDDTKIVGGDKSPPEKILIFFCYFFLFMFSSLPFVF